MKKKMGRKLLLNKRTVHKLSNYQYMTEQVGGSEVSDACTLDTMGSYCLCPGLSIQSKCVGPTNTCCGCPPSR